MIDLIRKFVMGDYKLRECVGGPLDGCTVRLPFHASTYVVPAALLHLEQRATDEQIRPISHVYRETNGPASTYLRYQGDQWQK